MHIYIWKCTVAESYIYIYIYIFFFLNFAFTLLFFFFLNFILSCFHSPLIVSLSSLPLHLFFLPHRPITDLHEPSRHRPIAANPRSATDLTHFGLSSLFSAFWLYVSGYSCVSGCACVSALCFRLCLCFGFVFQAWVSVFVFGLVLCFELWFFCFLFLFFFTGFDGHSRVCGCAVIFMGLMVVVVVHGRVSKLQEHPWQIFTYISVGVGPLPMRFGLNLKYTHEIGISTRP